MANRFMLYGANPSELAAQQRGYDQFYTGAAESNRAAATSAALANIQLAERARREDEEAMARDQALRINLSRYRTQDANDAMTFTENKRRFDVGLLRDDQRFSADEAFRQKELAARIARPNPLIARDIEADYVTAFAKAVEGEYDSESAITELFPSLPKEKVKQIWDANKRSRPLIEREWKQFQTAVDILNEYEQSKMYQNLSAEAIKDMPKKKGGIWPFRSLNPDRVSEESRGKGYEADTKDLSGAAASIKGNTALISQLVRTAKGYENPLPAPSWIKKPSAGLAATQPVVDVEAAVAPVASPVIAPTGSRFSPTDLALPVMDGSAGALGSPVNNIARWLSNVTPMPQGSTRVDMSGREVPPVGFVPPAGPPVIASKAEFDALPKDSEFVWVYPDGTRKRGTK